MCDSNAKEIFQNVTDCIVSMNTIVQKVDLGGGNSLKSIISVSPMQPRHASQGRPSKSPNSKKTPAISSTEKPVFAKSPNKIQASTEKNVDISKAPPHPPPPSTPAAIADL